MTISEATRLMFARSRQPLQPITNVSPAATSIPSGTQLHAHSVSPPGQQCTFNQDACSVACGEVGQQHSTATKSATWRPTTDVRDMVADDFLCCKSLRCVEAFVMGKHDIRVLRAEQADLNTLTTYRARSAWVSRQVPVLSPKKNEGSMLAANTLVCNAFFRRAYGVSNNTIESAKRNPRSPVVLFRQER